MDSIADSHAACQPQRVWPQHQAALTLLQQLLSDPKVNTVRWLDLACGEGQILTGFADRFPVNAKGKIVFTAYDLSAEYVRKTDKLAASSGFRSHRSVVGDLGDVQKLLGGDQFDFITLTNTVHEVPPSKLAVVLVDAILRLSATGTLFIYDMEKVAPPELGAVPWAGSDVASMLRAALDVFEVEAYDVPVAPWQHSALTAWSVQIHRDHLATKKEIVSLRSAAESATSDSIRKSLTDKRERCRAALEKLTIYESETADEQATKQDLLYEFWALSRALESR